MAWFQTIVEMPKHARGFHWATQYFSSIKEIGQFKIGQMHIFLQENDASICLCESWDKEVTIDMESIFNRIVPDSLESNTHHKKQQRHKSKKKHAEQKSNDNDDNDEAQKLPRTQDIVPRAKNILIGNDITIPIMNGKLNMGTWQGIWFCEHSNHPPKSRTCIVTINGVK
mmetsp:Transcript_16112/g.25483  ORF Transcript_16112/g.25483 Transcript_16112/m.25483 type:complete len:170 (-) Transcript_16112:60-569(-)